jgi:CRP-like cAMP-binding protein
MENIPENRVLTRNRLLAALPETELGLLRPHLELVSLEPGDTVFQLGDIIRNVYFPNNGMISLLAVTEEGQTIEVGFTGYEGMVGVSCLLGNQEKSYQAMVQVAADCFRVETKHVLDLFKRCGTFHDVALRYLSVIVKQISQSCVCNHFHSIEERLCRWLSVMCQRSNNKHLSLTQEFLSEMLGVQRTSVGMIANTLQNKGIIRYSRGKIEIVDAERLRTSACECYAVVEAEHERYLNDKSFPVLSDN